MKKYNNWQEIVEKMHYCKTDFYFKRNKCKISGDWNFAWKKGLEYFIELC